MNGDMHFLSFLFVKRCAPICTHSLLAQPRAQYMRREFIGFHLSRTLRMMMMYRLPNKKQTVLVTFCEKGSDPIRFRTCSTYPHRFLLLILKGEWETKQRDYYYYCYYRPWFVRSGHTPRKNLRSVFGHTRSCWDNRGCIHSATFRRSV